MQKFQRLELNKWRQFSNIELDFSSSVTILTGANGTGKTSVLNILARHFGWNANFVSTPFAGKKRRSTIWNDFVRFFKADIEDHPNRIEFGKITYAEGRDCILWAPSNSGPQYQPNYDNQSEVSGLHIPSHRPINSYQNVANIPTNPKTTQTLFQEYQNILLQTYNTHARQNPGLIQKQSIISLALFGYGNEAVVRNNEYIESFEGFQAVLRTILPPEIGFESLEIRMPEVVLKTQSGDFALEAMSGGINALFGIAWQIFMFGDDQSNTIVTIDEPENHLHPSMQRRLVPALARAFPEHQFIIATHSPFIVTSSREATVYGLYHDDDGMVISDRLSEEELAGSPNKILREILNVPSTLPIWVEEEIASALRETQGQAPTSRATTLWSRLEQLGITDAIGSIDLGQD